MAGEKATDLIKHHRDSTIEAIVSGWPKDFQPTRALSLGFEAEASFEEIINVYLEDDFEQ